MKEKITLFHLDDEDDLEYGIRKKQDEFLDLYSLYRRTGISPIKDELLQKAYELHILDPEFTFQI